MSDLIRASTDEPFSGSTGRGRGKLPDVVMPGRPNPLGLPDDLRSALDSLGSCIAGSAEDYGQYYRNSWIYGIILGWDCEEDHEHDDICGGENAMRELAARHRWSDEDVARLRRYRYAYVQATGRG